MNLTNVALRSCGTESEDVFSARDSCMHTKILVLAGPGPSA
jgi:hypothetical protein